MNSSSRQRLRLAHQVLDKELSNSNFGRRSFSRENQSQGNRSSRNVQSEISELERKLMDLEKKMENIDVSSEEEGARQEVGGKRVEEGKSRGVPRSIEGLLKKRKSSESSSEEDSEDDKQIYAKLQQKKSSIGKSDHIRKSKQQIKQKIASLHAQGQPNPRSKSKNKQLKIDTLESHEPLRNSVKSVKSRQSLKSNTSKHSNVSNSRKKIQRSTSKASIRSNGLSNQQLKQLQLQNAKDVRKISNLERQLHHYKRLCQKQQEKLEEYRVMEIQFRKLEGNFAKSEKIRLQQKKIIQGLKTKN